LEAVVAEHGLGKAKDRVRHWLLEHWDRRFTDAQRALLSRLHAAATVTMMFNLPAEIFLTDAEIMVLEDLTENRIDQRTALPNCLLSLQPPPSNAPRVHGNLPVAVARPHWIDAIKYPVSVYGCGEVARQQGIL
jgi:hypothetical protein